MTCLLMRISIKGETYFALIDEFLRHASSTLVDQLFGDRVVPMRVFA